MSEFYLTRSEWGAVRPKRWNALELPLSKVYHMATDTRTCMDEASCVRQLQQLQALHIIRNYGDIRYSFFIGGDGQVYEGRGWKHAPRLPPKHMDRNQLKSLLIGFSGMWVNDNLPLAMIRASSDLIDYAIEKEYLIRDYKSKDLFKDQFREEVIERIIKESKENKIKRDMRLAEIIKAVDNRDYIAPEPEVRFYKPRKTSSTSRRMSKL